MSTTENQTDKPYDIATTEIEKLLEIIPPAPQIRIGHFSDKGEALPRVLSRFCEENDYSYLLNCTDQSYYHTMLPRYEAAAHTTVKAFDLNRPNYMQHGKFYDYLFVSCTIPAQESAAFLQKSHRVIKNAGLILLFLPKDDAQAREEWEGLLEEHYFVATSHIDLDERWQVIISKKMHGWGG